MTGFYAVLKKELQDKFTSWRFIIIFTIVFLASIYFAYSAAQLIRTSSGSDDFIFMALFTVSRSTGGGNFGDLQSFLGVMAIGIPFIAIALGWDAINAERNRGTLSRLVSQPIYRDNIINAKFVAGILTLGIIITSIVLLVTGLGIRILGIVPSAEEAWRILFFIALSIIYGGFWLGLAILLSIVFRWIVASVLASIGILAFFGFGFRLIMSSIADSIHPMTTLNSSIANVQFLIGAWRFSPIELFKEAESLILLPGYKTMSDLLTIYQGSSSSPSNSPLYTPLALNQSLSATWPSVIVLFMLMIICFSISYAIFMRQEIRAT